MEARNKEELTRILSGYEALLREIWEKTSPVAGELTLELIIKTSIKRVSLAFSFLEDLRISSEGMHFDKLKKGVDKLTYQEIKNGFQALIFEILTTFSIMWGEILNKELSSIHRVYEIKKDSQ